MSAGYGSDNKAYSEKSGDDSRAGNDEEP